MELPAKGGLSDLSRAHLSLERDRPFPHFELQPVLATDNSVSVHTNLNIIALSGYARELKPCLPSSHPKQIQLPPGVVVRLPATWQNYQALCQQHGDGSIPRVKYRDGEVLLMSPLLVHGQDVNLIADIVKALLEHDRREYDAFTPVTMELPEKSGIEPYYCFYIGNWEAVSGKKQIDWRNNPPPDLAVKIDVTSYSDVEDYRPYRVPKVWLFKKQKLLIYQMQETEYQLQMQSRYFSAVQLQDMSAHCVQIAYDLDTRAAIGDLRQQLGNRSQPI